MTEIFSLICRLAEKDGVVPVNQLPGVWERELPDGWKIVLNAHNNAMKYKDILIPPFEMYVEFNGWVAGIIGPMDGAIAAGSEANEDNFISALEKAISEKVMT